MYSHSNNSLAIIVVTDNCTRCLNVFQPMLLHGYQLQLDISVFAQSSRENETYIINEDYKHHQNLYNILINQKRIQNHWHFLY